MMCVYQFLKIKYYNLRQKCCDKIENSVFFSFRAHKVPFHFSNYVDQTVYHNVRCIENNIDIMGERRTLVPCRGFYNVMHAKNSFVAIGFGKDLVLVKKAVVTSTSVIWLNAEN